MEKLNDLVRIRTFADMHGVTPECVRIWAKQGRVEVIKIDNVAFIDRTKPIGL